MGIQAVDEYRRRRLQEFVDAKFEGNKAALGRALEYRDGAFVGQMLRGERPITEKSGHFFACRLPVANYFAVRVAKAIDNTNSNCYSSSNPHNAGKEKPDAQPSRFHRNGPRAICASAV